MMALQMRQFMLHGAGAEVRACGGEGGYTCRCRCTPSPAPPTAAACHTCTHSHARTYARTTPPPPPPPPPPPRPGQPAARHRPGRPQGHGHRQILHQSGEPLARAAALAGATLASGLYVWGGGSPPDGSAACPLSSVAPFPGCAQVPTDYYSLWGRRTHTYQYSVTEYYHRFTGNEEAPPAVYLL